MSRIWWFLPLCESLHFIGMAMLVGVAGVIDLRIASCSSVVRSRWLRRSSSVVISRFGFAMTPRVFRAMNRL